MLSLFRFSALYADCFWFSSALARRPAASSFVARWLAAGTARRLAREGLVTQAQRSDIEAHPALARALAAEADTLRESVQASHAPVEAAYLPTRSAITPVADPPRPPDLNPHVLRDFDLAEIFPYINPQMLFVRHLGYRGRFSEAMDAGEAKAVDLWNKVRQVENDQS